MFPHVETFIYGYDVILYVGTQMNNTKRHGKGKIAGNVFKAFGVLGGFKSYITVGTIYMATDLAYDYGLLRLSYPLGDILYFGRYGIVIAWALLKFCRKKGLLQTLRNRFVQHVPRRRRSKKGGIETEIDISERPFPNPELGDHSRYDAKGTRPENLREGMSYA